jgi:hypothetical protein
LEPSFYDIKIFDIDRFRDAARDEEPDDPNPREMPAAARLRWRGNGARRYLS